MTLTDELEWRGFVNQTTFKNIAELNEPRTFYWGVDPSADSMTIGNLAPAMMIRHFIAAGHNAVLLVGGATGMIGDPDGKKQERSLKTLDEIRANRNAIVKQYKTIFSGQDFTIVDNYDWFKNINYLDFLRDIGKHVSMTQMLDREFIQNRIGEGGDGISYAEFSYSLIQGFDFLHLYREHGVTLQLAGADQWGNSISGVQLVRRIEGAEAHVMTAPLIVNKHTGVKFGKSEDGAIWLDENKTSPYKFYQFWLNLADEMAEDLVKIYTLLDRHTIETFISEHRQDPSRRLLQEKLAYEVTAIVHGKSTSDSVRLVTKTLYGGSTIDTLSEADLDRLSAEIPVTSSGDIITLLVKAGIAKSNGEAKRLIESGAISVNGRKIEAPQPVQAVSLIKKGKNSFILVR